VRCVVTVCVYIDSRMKMIVFSPPSVPILSPREFNLGVLACFSLSAVFEMPLDLEDTLCFEVAVRPTPKPDISERDNASKHSAIDPLLPISLWKLALPPRATKMKFLLMPLKTKEAALQQTPIGIWENGPRLIAGLQPWASRHGMHDITIWDMCNGIHA
jgi:hypothetical protein